MSSNLVNQRVNFATVKNPMPYPDFLDVQLKSFKDFLQLDTPPEKRKNDGLYKVFSENFPIADTRNNFVLEFLDYYIDPNTKAICKKMVQEKLLDTLSNERIFQEYNKLLLSMRPSIGLTFLKEIKALWPCLDILSSTMQRLDFHPEGDVWKHTLLVTDLAALCRHKTSNPLGFMWSALLHDIGKPEVTTPEGRAPRHNESGVKIFDSQVTCYIPDKKLQRYIRTMIYYHMHLMNMVRNGARDYGYFKILKGINGIVPVDDLILITKCDKLGRYKDEHENINRFDYVMKEKMARLGKEAKEPVINGNDLKGLGIEPSSKYKEILEWAYDQQLKGHDRVAILKMLKGR